MAGQKRWQRRRRRRRLSVWPATPCMAASPLLSLLFAASSPVNVLCGTQQKIVGHFMQLLPCHTETQGDREREREKSRETHTPIPFLAQFARSTNFHKIFPALGKSVRPIWTRILQFFIIFFFFWFFICASQTPLSALAPSNVPFLFFSPPPPSPSSFSPSSAFSVWLWDLAHAALSTSHTSFDENVFLVFN